jgi:NTP pyrophosphatase (non-canonical NTP hydrolase)
MTKKIDFDKYQSIAKRTAIYPRVGKNYIYPTLGLAGEAGEVADKVKKILRDGGGKLTRENKEELKGELGDIMWYVAQLSTELGLTLSAVVEGNVKKLSSRKKRGKLGGSGDNR